MDENILTRAIEGLLAILIGVGGWLMKTANADIRELFRHSASNAQNLAEFKTEVAKDYADKSSIALEISSLRQETRDSTTRLHDRIDVMSQDIKQILQRVK